MQIVRDVSLSSALGVEIHLMASPGELEQWQVDLAMKLTSESGLDLIVVEKGDVRINTLNHEE